MNQRGVLAVITGLAVATTAAVLVGESVVRRAEGMQTADTDAATFEAAQAGENLKLIVRVDDVDQSGSLDGPLLAKRTESAYSATATNVRARWKPQTKFLMGAARDLKPGAVVEIVGTVEADHIVDASKLVILSEFVHVVP